MNKRFSKIYIQSKFSRNNDKLNPSKTEKFSVILKRMKEGKKPKLKIKIEEYNQKYEIFSKNNKETE